MLQRHIHADVEKNQYYIILQCKVLISLYFYIIMQKQNELQKNKTILYETNEGK